MVDSHPVIKNSIAIYIMLPIKYMKQIVYLVNQWPLQLHTSRSYSDVYNLSHVHYWQDYTYRHSRIYTRATGARAQGGKFPGAAY